jgi:exopolyphosphatase/guanosine-5'-triphosphate,3'-diphosphate pyrophosphatase
MKHNVIAAIDIGTNSMRLIVARVHHRTAAFTILDREREFVRLGTGATDMKYLSEAAMNRGMETLRRFKIIADTYNANIRTIATSAVREAINRSEFIRRVKATTGISIEVVSGFEEARLIYLGVLQALPVYGKEVLSIDIGGGSTEFLLGKKRDILYDNSLKLGSLRLTERFFPSEQLQAKQIKDCREYIHGMLNPVARQIKNSTHRVVVGSSGTIGAIAHIIKASRGKEPNGKLNNFSFSAKELFTTVGKIIAARDVKQRTKIEGLDPARADIIVAGALLLEQIFKEFKLDTMLVSDYALREGIVLDTIEKTNNIHRHHLSNIRTKSIEHLLAQFSDDDKHIRHVTRLSLRIFDNTKTLHKLSDAERELLETAGLLHEIGLFISHAQHHRHSYYLIRNAELLGFTENEQEMVANIARYHRKSHPKLRHEGFSLLASEERNIVIKLAAILRIADGLDRTHTSAVKDFRVRISRSIVTFSLKKYKRKNVDLELWGAERKKKLFEEAFKKKVVFRFH